MNRAALAIPVLSASLLLVALGCGDDTVEPSASVAPGSTGAPTPGAPLEPRTFIATASTGFAIVEGSRVVLTFEDGRLGVNAGCNSMSGMYVVVQETLRVEPMAMTEMACEPALMEQDTWLAEFLTSGPAISVTGDTLVLGDETMGMTLLDREVADPDRPLVGTVWTVTTVIDADAAMTGWGEATATITIEPAASEPTNGAIEATALVEAGCNRGSASVVVSSDTLTFGPLALTKMMCDGPAMELEAAVVTTLTGTVAYTIEADRLTLTNGESGLILAGEE